MSDTKSLLSFVLLFFFTLIAHKSRFSHIAQMTTFHCRLFFIYVMFIRESDDWVTTIP